jgi:hypothetical protein
MDKILAIKEIRKRLGVSLIVAKEMYENSEHSPVLVVSVQPLQPQRSGFAKNFVAYDNCHRWTPSPTDSTNLRLDCLRTNTRLVLRSKLVT